MTVDPQLVTAIASTCCVGYLMAVAGVGKHGLEWRRHRICPSCGHQTPQCICR